MEALIGAAFVEKGKLSYGLRVIDRFDILENFDFSSFEHVFNSQIRIDDHYYAELDKNRHKIGKNSTIKKLYYFFNKKKKTRVFKTSNINKMIGTLTLNSTALGEGADKRKAIYSLLLRDFQRKNLCYTFKNEQTLKNAFKPGNNVFERLEFLGDSVLDIYALHNLYLIHKKYNMKISPEIFHGLKVILLSNFTFTKLNAFLEGYKFLHLPFDSSDMNKGKLFYEKFKKNERFRDLWFMGYNEDLKALGDSFEALAGAIFVDGGWKAIHKVYGRIFLPFIYFYARHEKYIIVDMKHMVVSDFQAKGEKVEFVYDPKVKTAQLVIGMEKEVYLEVKDMKTKKIAEIELCKEYFKQIGRAHV